ncbi:MAG: hypothetical protein QOE44_215 [Solirubrobacteraceae bacterium]|nr:hypothetical protein [Solirubrobacteraceae bacterium]
MTLDPGVAPVVPRWLGKLWVWLPAGAALVLLGGAAGLQSGSGSRAVWWGVAAFGCAGAYAGRERWPVGALLATLLVVASSRLDGLDVLGSQFDVVYLLLLFLPVLPLVAVASHLALRRSLAALVATVVVTVGVSPDAAWSSVGYSSQATVARYMLTVGVPAMIALGAWLAGWALQTRQRYAEALLERSVSLELRRDAEAARAVAEERTRIARELHDVITHSVAVMVVQASAAGAVWERDPVRARESLAAVEASGRTVMADLRGMLHAMRLEEASAPAREAPPGLEQLPRLVDQIRMTGLASRMTVSGTVGRVGPLTGLSLLRIAQESVTNALRHARAATIAIDIVVDATTVQLSVADDGVGLDQTRRAADKLDPHRDGGHGLIGMQERAKVIGGTLGVHPGAAGGTVVTVRAPLRGGELA